MALNRGAKLGSYEVQSPLGAGGMGEVYLATQSNLGRHIAIKVLASASASDPTAYGGLNKKLGRLPRSTTPTSFLSTILAVRTHCLHCDGVRGRADIARLARIGSALYQEGATDRYSGRGRAGQGTRSWDRAPRSETGKHHGHEGRLRQGPRFRSCQAAAAGPSISNATSKATDKACPELAEGSVCPTRGTLRG
jgi:serine/threonine protein kinase